MSRGFSWLACRHSFSNTAVLGANLGIVKTASTASGPGAANGAVIRDVPGPGLDCSTPSPTASCNASGGAACPGATVPVANLLGSGGVAMPTLPAGGAVVITLQCLLTATGLP